MQVLSDLRWEAVSKCVTGTQAMGDVHSLLPPLQLTTVKLLKPAKLLEIFVLIVVIVEVQVAHLVEATRKLAPRTLPLEISCLAAGSPLTSPRSDVITTVLASSRPADGLRGALSKLEQVSTFHAVPVAFWSVLQADTVSVVRRIATIAKKKNFLVFRAVADWTRIALLLLFFWIFT